MKMTTLVFLLLTSCSIEICEDRETEASAICAIADECRAKQTTPACLEWASCRKKGYCEAANLCTVLDCAGQRLCRACRIADERCSAESEVRPNCADLILACRSARVGLNGCGGDD